MENTVQKPLRRMIVAIVAGVLSVILISLVLKGEVLSAPVRLALAVISVAAYAFCLISYVRLIQTTDELHRRIHLEALAIAFPTSAVGVLAFEYLRKAGFINEFKPDYVLMMMMTLWALGYLIAWRRYR